MRTRTTLTRPARSGTINRSDYHASRTGRTEPYSRQTGDNDRTMEAPVCWTQERRGPDGRKNVDSPSWSTRHQPDRRRVENGDALPPWYTSRPRYLPLPEQSNRPRRTPPDVRKTARRLRMPRAMLLLRPTTQHPPQRDGGPGRKDVTGSRSNGHTRNTDSRPTDLPSWTSQHSAQPKSSTSSSTSQSATPHARNTDART